MKERDKEKQQLVLINAKLKEKGLKSFIRCGINFSSQYKQLEVDEQIFKRLKQEKKLIIKEI